MPDTEHYAITAGHQTAAKLQSNIVVNVQTFTLQWFNIINLCQDNEYCEYCCSLSIISTPTAYSQFFVPDAARMDKSNFL